MLAKEREASEAANDRELIIRLSVKIVFFIPPMEQGVCQENGD